MHTTKTQELLAKADQFASRAAAAKQRTVRNTFLSLEQSCRSLAQEAETPDRDERRAAHG